MIDNNEEYAKLAFENLQNEQRRDSFEAELCLQDGMNVRYPHKKVSPLSTLHTRHGLLEKTTELHRKLQRVV